MSANITDEEYQVCEMFFEDGMKERKIALSMGMTEQQVHEILAAYEQGYYGFIFHKDDEEDAA